MKYKPVDIVNNFGDSTTSCGCCKNPIYFPLIRNPQHIYDQRPKHCKVCGAEIDWEGGDTNDQR